MLSALRIYGKIDNDSRPREESWTGGDDPTYFCSYSSTIASCGQAGTQNAHPAHRSDCIVGRAPGCFCISAPFRQANSARQRSQSRHRSWATRSRIIMFYPYRLPVNQNGARTSLLPSPPLPRCRLRSRSGGSAGLARRRLRICPARLSAGVGR